MSGINYCAVFLGDLEGVKDLISEVSVGEQIGWAESRNVMICTFISLYQTHELSEYLNHGSEEYENRNFFIMKPEEAVIFFNNDTIKEKLFRVFEPLEDPQREYDLENMRDEEKEDLVNYILDKGPNMSKYDERLLKLLSK